VEALSYHHASRVPFCPFKFLCTILWFIASSEGIFVLELNIIFLFHQKILKKSNVTNKGAFNVSGWQIGEKSVLGGIFRISPVFGGTAKIFPN
jgi:hypothetical protein